MIHPTADSGDITISGWSTAVDIREGEMAELSSCEPCRVGKLLTVRSLVRKQDGGCRKSQKSWVGIYDNSDGEGYTSVHL